MRSHILKPFRLSGKERHIDAMLLHAQQAGYMVYLGKHDAVHGYTPRLARQPKSPETGQRVVWP